jgi:transposase-like protein
MSTMTLEKSVGVAGDRSVPAEAGTGREAVAPTLGRASDPEVAPVAKRRNHSASYKLRILKELDESSGKIGIILRREGLYSSYIPKWRQWKENMTQPNKTSANKQAHNELAKLRRENERLSLKLKKAEGLIELQKKPQKYWS